MNWAPSILHKYLNSAYRFHFLPFLHNVNLISHIHQCFQMFIFLIHFLNKWPCLSINFLFLSLLSFLHPLKQIFTSCFQLSLLVWIFCFNNIIPCLLTLHIFFIVFIHYSLYSDSILILRFSVFFRNFLFSKCNIFYSTFQAPTSQFSGLNALCLLLPIIWRKT